LAAQPALHAQTDATQAPAASPVTQYSEESAIPLSEIDSAATPTFSADVQAALTSGTLEIRQIVNYDATASILHVRGILVAQGSPLPTPPGATGLMPAWSYDVSVNEVKASIKPRRTVSFFGTVVSSGTPAPFGDLTGASVVVSASY